MSNSFASLVFYTWPVVAVVLFRVFPRPVALAWAIIGGYLFLPGATGTDLPGLPRLDKLTMANVTAAILCVIIAAPKPARRRARPARGEGEALGAAGAEAALMQRNSLGGKLITLLVLLVIAVPFFTALANSDTLFYGRRVLPGLQIYDAVSFTLRKLFVILPFLLARRYLATPESHVALLRVLVTAGVIYAALAFYEVLMSPQLNMRVYGFFPHSFAQHFRAGGYRPIVFLEHGLRVGIFLTMCLLAAITTWRLTEEKAKSMRFLLATGWLLAAVTLSQNFGALGIAIILGSAALMLRPGGQVYLAAILATMVLLFPVLRNANAIPLDDVVTAAASFSEDRAASLDFRLRNEDILLDHARQRPLFGWGDGGRSRVFDPETGADLATVDGYWVIVFGVSGGLGYVAEFGLLTLPLIGLALRRRRLGLTMASTGLALILAANLIDLIPNSSNTAVTWLVAGALAGRYEWAVAPTLAAMAGRGARGSQGNRRQRRQGADRRPPVPAARERRQPG